MPKGMGRIANVIGDCGSCEAAEQSAFIVAKGSDARQRNGPGPDTHPEWAAITSGMRTTSYSLKNAHPEWAAITSRMRSASYSLKYAHLERVGEASRMHQASCPPEKKHPEGVTRAMRMRYDIVRAERGEVQEKLCHMRMVNGT